MGLALLLPIHYGVIFSTSHSLWGYHSYFTFIMRIALVLPIHYGVIISTSHSLWS